MDDIEANGMEQKFPEFIINVNHEAKLKELLRNLTSVELQLCSDASKEFIKILKSDEGPEFLRSYVQSSSRLIELSQVWDFCKGKPGFLHILNLVAAVLKHWKNSTVSDGVLGIVQALDNFARFLIEDKMGDLYKELNSKEAKRQNAVLLLLASIVRRNSHLAWDVAKAFDFKLAAFTKLAEVRLRAKKIAEVRRKSYSTRKAFVGFAMAFLEVGNPRFLRGIVQKKEMYSGVLRGLGNDDEETVVSVLSILRDRVLGPESMVPTGLRSVLFGSVTLQQLISISGRSDFGDAAELAHNVLVMVCTDPLNGLMPDLERQPCPLHGNKKRLLGLMKHLMGTEVASHKSLLLAIINGRPSLGSAYLEEFPFSLEDPSSNNWFGAISLASDVVSAVTNGLSVSSVDKRPGSDSQYVQDILKCIGARPFTRLVINKGLLHSDSLVKHGTLKLVLEVLKLFEFLMKVIDLSALSNNQLVHGRESIKAEIQHRVRLLLPDPQVLLSILSSLNSCIKNLKSTMKRKAVVTEVVLESEHHENVSKRLKTSTATEDLDILISGINPSEVDFSVDDEVADLGGKQRLENGDDILECIRDLWGMPQYSDLTDGDICFYLKILDALQIYYRTIPMATEGSVDLFKFLPDKPLALPKLLQQSLLKLLNEHVNQFTKNAIHNRTPPQMYKYLEPFVTLLICSPVTEIKELAYSLARAAMLSTGAFDNSIKDICAWFFFIPGYCWNCICYEEQEVEIFEKLSSIIISFLCDVVSTTGNNLYRYMELMKQYIFDTEVGAGLNLEVSPFVICMLEKCIRLLSSESGSSTIAHKTLISHYVCNSIKYILDTQVNAGPLSCLIDHVLFEKLENCTSQIELSGCSCEWRPVKALLHFVREILHQQHYTLNSNVDEDVQLDNSFAGTLRNIERVLGTEGNARDVGLTLELSFSLMCTQHTELLKNFPLILSVSNKLHNVPFTVLSSIFFLKPSLLTDISKLFPEMFLTAVGSVTQHKEKKGDSQSKVLASHGFASYLSSAPFHVLFSSIVQSTSLDLIEQSGLLKLLHEKVSEMAYDQLVSSLCNIFFWINNTRSSYRVRSLDNLKMLSNILFELTEHLLNQALVKNTDTASLAYFKAVPLHYLVEVVFSHPAVESLLNCPLSHDAEFSDSVFEGSLEKFLEPAQWKIHTIDHKILDLMKMVSEHGLAISSNDQMCDQVVDRRIRISRAFKMLEQKLLLAFKSKFDACISSMDFKPLLPTFYVSVALIHCISPFELLELVHWTFSRIGFDGKISSSRSNAHSIALHLASCCFDSLAAHMDRPLTESKLCGFLGGTEDSHFDVLKFEKLFFQVLGFCHHFKLDIADACLLKAVKVVNTLKGIWHAHLSSAMTLSRVMVSTPVNMTSYCMHGLNRTKAELLYLITGMNPLHLSVFGFMFSEMVEKLFLPDASETKRTRYFSDEELLMLLPTVVLYLNSIIPKFRGQLCKHASVILAYGRVLLSGFSQWNIFVSGPLSDIWVEEPTTASTEGFLKLFSDSLLGKAVLMVQDQLLLSEDMSKPKCRLRLFNSVCQSSTDLIFDDSFGEGGLRSLKQPLAFVNRVIAKIKLCRLLLFLHYQGYCSQTDDGEKEVVSPRVTSRVEKSRIRFLKILINSWLAIVKNLDYSGEINDQNLSLDRFLEVFVMNNIFEVLMEIRDCLIKLDSLPFIEQLVKSFLLYRFGDLVTTKILRTIITSLAGGNFSCVSIIQLLLAHSQFAKAIQSASRAHVSANLGVVLTPMQSILRSSVIPLTDLDTSDCKSNEFTTHQYLNMLELVKFVRVLFHIYALQREAYSADDTDINFTELIYLLLSSYGATCSEIDLEIYNLLIEIESIDKSCAGTVAQMDYLWGVASIKVRGDREQEKNMQSADRKNMEVYGEHQKMIFRENLPIDPKTCAQTVLNFPYNRYVKGENLYKLQKHISVVMHEAKSATSKLQVYDPFFILRFSIHCLSMSYVEPIEFVSVGLLAITFVSLSSTHDDLRKLGYETLSKFKSALEKCPKKKDVSRLRLLLSYLQNGIEEPWQKIPSIIAIFVAEASMVLLDSSHYNYSTISKHLMNSPRASTTAIPLFPTFLWSSSKTFEADRLWMLRLLYAGLNTDDDAQMYIRNSVFQNLMNCYSSPLSDDDSNGLIIQIVKKAAQLRKAVWFLVEHCGLIPWLSFVISSIHWNKCRDQKRLSLTQLPIILEVLNCVTKPRSIFEWLQKNAMEQLSELLSHLYKLLVTDIVHIETKGIFCNSILQILMLVLKISQKRKVYQPHFTMSEEGLFQLYKAVDDCSKPRCSLTVVSGLKAVLMSTPPVTVLRMDQENLSKFLRWAIATAIQSTLSESTHAVDSDDCLTSVSAKSHLEECLVSKLLRWLTASAILGQISCNLDKLRGNDSLGKLDLASFLSLFGCNDECYEENAGYKGEDELAASILFLLQKLEFNHRLLPSAIAALCLLLSDSFAGSDCLTTFGMSVPALCSKIHCPVEANPAWRWSYYQPWRDLSTDSEAGEDWDEIHASGRILILASNVLQRKSGCCHFFKLEDGEKEMLLRVYDWETRLTHLPSR